jgi:hypothetical protein
MMTQKKSRVSQSILLINYLTKLSNRQTICHKDWKAFVGAEVVIKITFEAFLSFPAHASTAPVISFSRGLAQQLVTPNKILIHFHQKTQICYKKISKLIDIADIDCHVVTAFVTHLPQKGKQ